MQCNHLLTLDDFGVFSIGEAGRERERGREEGEGFPFVLLMLV